MKKNPFPIPLPKYPEMEKIEELQAQGWARSEFYYKRGHHICAKCGEFTRSVLDGEAWCDNCQRYQ